MTTQPLLLLIAALLVACVTLLLTLLRRRDPAAPGDAHAALKQLGDGQERTERAMREELARGREEADRASHLLRSEVFQHLGVLSEKQKEQLDHVLAALKEMGEASQAGARELRGEVGATLKAVGDSVVRTMGEMAAGNSQQMEGLRATVEGRLELIRADNASQLEQVRQTVDDKLQGVLEQRLGESFRQVSERLEQVHRGLGEMQTLASGVGDLKKVLANVSVRGAWGEVQLAKLLEQVLTADQYEANVATNEYNGARVEFAIRLPGHDLGPVWLPIDAKFPLEDYQRLVDAQEASDAEAMEAAGRQLDARIRACAKDICTKYLNPPRTTDFAIMFLPTEGLYAEVVRRTHLVDAVQREWRVVVAGPVTLWAILNSLQMGFRTLAIQQRSSEVWEVLGAVKTEFGKFGEVLAKVKRKLHAVSREMDAAGVRTRAIQRKLRGVEALPDGEAHRILPIGPLVVSDAAAEEEPAADAAD